MTDEPYRYVEAMANRRDYVETQLAAAGAVVGLNYNGGILLLTLAPEPQKIFEIYDRIALGAMGHPGDVERLRMSAIEVASAEGFTRSPADVSLRRLANFSFSPLLKNTFEQVYGPVCLVRLLFAELGQTKETDLFICLDFDGTQVTSGARKPYAVLGGTSAVEEKMAEHLARRWKPNCNLETTLLLALQTWALAGSAEEKTPDDPALNAAVAEALRSKVVEAAVLERKSGSKQLFRRVSEAELRNTLNRVKREGSE